MGEVKSDEPEVKSDESQLGLISWVLVLPKSDEPALDQIGAADDDPLVKRPPPLVIGATSGALMGASLLNKL